MQQRRGSILAVWLAGAALVAAQCGCQTGTDRAGEARAAPAVSVPTPTFDDAFWKHWGDGRAELAGYDLTFPRYGLARKGVAVTIFVTETFSNAARVKADPGQHPESDEFPVMKLNLVEDFSTGIYDYNVMSSAFVALTPINGRPVGSLTKVSFSSQEWCGHVYSQLLFDNDAARLVLHSYFDGEADREQALPVPNDALDGDALLLWARGFMAPVLTPGERRKVPLVRSLKQARVRHQPVVVETATLDREVAPRSVKVPAGRFEAEVRTVAIAGGPSWTFHVERDPPHRILQWESSEGEQGRLLASKRLAYWKMNGTGGESALAQLGLAPRALRTP